ncbi:F-box only protein 36b [Aplochiton taeniatus]
MAILLGENLFEISGQGPSPIKDFYHFAVSRKDVIFRWWKISLRNDCRNAWPGEVKESHHDFLDDSRLQSQVSVVFGTRILHYTKALCQGHYDYLERLPDPLLLQILANLELEDVARLGHTSSRFRKLCSSEEFWERAVRGRCDTVSDEVSSLALELGWRSVFFTSKLQLQKQISRRRLRFQQQQKGHCSTDELTSESSDAETENHDQIEPSPGTAPSPTSSIHHDSNHGSPTGPVSSLDSKHGSEETMDPGSADPGRDKLGMVKSPAQDWDDRQAENGRGDRS